MNHDTTILVDTQLERDDAAAAAMDIYLRLAGEGMLSPQLENAETPRFRLLDTRLAGPGIHAVTLHATGHKWVHDGMAARLVEGGRENGIFCRYDGIFVVQCPDCRHELSLGDEGSEALEEALSVWCEAPDSAYVACPACATWTPLPAWRSPRRDFAVGHFAISLHGTQLHELSRGGGSHAALALRHRLGDLAGEFTVVYGRS
ncbi:uncharacterized protein YbaR (Trm112 family) [Luteibacter sp. Sphag1AF]|uniref:hypothetical protein n=1 Tax=Luteibacter sp. Sphag1AF TaxID=2587031 RepID=UPI001615E266|nr:hypothetical protein [Luteibacter sp. Sphag1AF]MBB3227814.1 uncharacterized protein YbaR (Trm112 family) [Luteibacter sp. Sphag1AF]